jgi:hypothetical protein
VGGKKRADTCVDMAVDLVCGDRPPTTQQRLIHRHPQHKAGELASGEERGGILSRPCSANCRRPSASVVIPFWNPCSH